MNASHFRGPLAAELSAFTATLEASAAANKAMLTQLRAMDRLTEQTALLTGTLDEAFARTWLAPCESRGPNTRLARFHLVRRFCRFLAKRRPETFIPGESMRPRGRPAVRPHIYSRSEIRSLLEGALSLRDWEGFHSCPIRSRTMYAIILLLATAGLRISEALHLTLADVDLEADVLSIRQSKFRKSHLVPLSKGTADVAYLEAQRDVSPNTVLAYRDSIKLLLRFVARRTGRQVIRFGWTISEPTPYWPSSPTSRPSGRTAWPPGTAG